MTPIHELLNRIRWDKEFGQGRFEIGYYDRREGVVHRVALQEIVFPAGERRVFELVDESGQPRRIPFHPSVKSAGTVRSSGSAPRNVANRWLVISWLVRFQHTRSVNST